MADLVWGEPVVGGETVPPGSPRGVWLYRMGDDGTRRSVRYHPSLGNTGISVLQDGIVKAESAGCIPHKILHSEDPFYEKITTGLSDKDRDEGRYVGFANAGGGVYFGPIGTTPGTSYYVMRRILGEHALRYISEHNPSQLRFADPTQKRIETIAHELTDVDRVKAANADQFIRGEIGHLWGFIHFFVVTPPKRSDLWHPIRDEIDELLTLFCAVCEGSGLSHRTTRKHPYEDWQKWQRAGMRFTVDRQFDAKPYTKNGIVTAETHEGDLQDFVNALDWASEGYVDDDYLAPRTVVADSPSNPIMPDFGDNMIRSYLSSGWRLNYDAHMREPLAGLETGIYRKWCSLNLLAMLDDRNFTAFPGFQTIMDAALNFEVTPGWVHNFNQLFFVDNAYTGTFGPSSFSQVLLNGAITNRDDIYLTDGADASVNGGPWVDTAERDRRLDLIDSILGDSTVRA